MSILITIVLMIVGLILFFVLGVALPIAVGHFAFEIKFNVIEMWDDGGIKWIMGILILLLFSIIGTVLVKGFIFIQPLVIQYITKGM